jgi:hypothetical protein
MPKKQEKVSARAAAREVLKGKRGAVPIPEVIDAVLADPRVKLGGKTPRASVAAVIYTAADFEHADGKVKLSAQGRKAAQA